jgi:hypothetical protein
MVRFLFLLLMTAPTFAASPSFVFFEGWQTYYRDNFALLRAPWNVQTTILRKLEKDCETRQGHVVILSTNGESKMKPVDLTLEAMDGAGFAPLHDDPRIISVETELRHPVTLKAGRRYVLFCLIGQDEMPAGLPTDVRHKPENLDDQNALDIEFSVSGVIPFEPVPWIETGVLKSIFTAPKDDCELRILYRWNNPGRGRIPHLMLTLDNLAIIEIPPSIAAK